jgi:hypothetical protein
MADTVREFLEGIVERVYQIPENYYTPEQYNNLYQTLNYLKNDFTKIIRKKANEYRLNEGIALEPGTRAKKYRTSMDSIIMITDYWKDFFSYDAIAFNTNGLTNMPVVDNAGASVGDRQLTISQFIGYASSIHPLIRRDALKYYLRNDDNIPYKKYEMPEILCTTNAGMVILGPCNTYGHIINGIVQHGDDGQLPLFNSHDYRNLVEVARNYMNNPPTITTGRMFKSQSIDYQPLMLRFSFPNVLLSTMLYKDPEYKPPTDKREPLGRPINSEETQEFWVKLYNGDYYFPYDKSRYYLPPGYRMVEAPDKRILYIDQGNNVSATFPIGSYMIATLVGGNAVMPIINSTEHREILTQIQTSMEAMNNGNRNVTLDNFNNQFQEALQLVAYMKNLLIVGRTAKYNITPVPRGGGKTKKIKIIRAAKSKSKSMTIQSDKRAFRKTNKRNKTSKHS